MSLEALQERRNDLANKIQNLAEKYDEKNGWPSSSVKSDWDATNAEYDSVVAEMKGARNSGVLSRIAEVKALQNGPANREAAERAGYQDAGPGLIRDLLAGQSGQAPGMEFMDSSGRKIQALRHGQPLMSAERSRQECPELSDVSIGDVVHSMLVGEPRNMDRQAYNAVTGGVDTSGGYILNPTLSSRLIDLARDAMVTGQAGAQTVPMEAREVNLMSITSDPTSYWRSEGVKTTASSMTFGRITMRARTLACIIPVPIELLEDSANAGRIIENAMRQAIAHELDRAALLGTSGGEEIVGLRNSEGIQTVTGVGTPADYNAPRQAVGKILQAKYPGSPNSLAWIGHPRDIEVYDALVDTTGQPLMPSRWVADLNQLATTSLPTDEGGSNNESIQFVGDFSQMLIGMRTSGINIRVAADGVVTDSDSKEYNATSGLMRHIVAYMRADMAVLRPSWFTLLSGITAA